MTFELRPLKFYGGECLIFFKKIVCTTRAGLKNVRVLLADPAVFVALVKLA